MIIFQNIRSSKKNNPYKKESFVVVNTDLLYGHYIHNIINTMKSYGLVEQDARYGAKRAKKIKTGDALVVGDCTSTFKYDFRVVKHKNLDQIDELDGRRFKVYDAIEDYEKILAKIKAYAKANDTQYPGCCSYGSASYFNHYKRKKKKKEEVTKVTINVDFDEEPQPVFMKRDVCSFKRVDPVRTTEKATFFCDWVKVGQHQFDILLDALGNEYIEDGARNKYYIREDRYGQRYLTVTR